MKINFRISSIICSILVGIAMLSCTTQQPVELEEENSLEGVWEFVSGERIFQDSTLTYPGPQMPDIKAIKIITEHHWGVSGMAPSNDMNWGFAGTYSITDNTYTEYVEIQAIPENIGDSVVFTYNLDKDYWIITREGHSEKWKRIE